jgi:hypothetical protein
MTAWTMSSETSTRNAATDDDLQPWQLFTLAGLAAALAVVFVSRGAGYAPVVLLSLTVAAAAFAGVAALRAFGPLAGVHHGKVAEFLGGRTRAALEREKVLVLRSIKDLDFDRSMGKVSEKDYAEMSARLRARAAGLIRELDLGTGYREQIEREIAKRANVPVRPTRRVCTCGVTNDSDARFCKSCGHSLTAA